jgi:riboflavin kinase / FMN adenylyltransferase
MRITRQLDDLRLERAPIVLAVGSFDGVHRGHQAVLSRAVASARTVRGEAWALTLDPHPLKVLKPESAPPLITSTEHKVRLIEALGLDGCVVMPFTADVAAEEPAAFLAGLKEGVPSLRELVVGDSWTFGRRAKGNVDLARELAPAHGFGVTLMDPVSWKGSPISSTRVRKAVAQGHLADAEQMMGRPFSILGTVVPGRHVGAQLGFPTANLDPHNEVRPPSGVYAVRAAVGNRWYGGAAFLAEAADAKSTPSGSVVEVHLIGFDGDVYGLDIEAVFVEWVREVRRFPTRMQLKEQIARDVEEIGRRLSEPNG